MLDIIRIAKEAPGTILAVPAGALVDAFTRTVEKTLVDMERVIVEKRETILFTPQEVVDKLKVDPSTLWRWQKRGYLVPVKVGGENRYRSTDIDKILEG